MSRRIKKALYPLLAAVITAAAAGAFCLFSAEPAENGRALIYFTETNSTEGVVNTEVTRSVSSLRKAVTEEDFLTSAGAASGLSAKELKASLSVERLGASSGAEIILKDLPSPSEAPIILINILCLAEQSEDIPPFEVISYFDMPHTPALPYIPIAISAGLGAGLVCFLLMTGAGSERPQRYRPEKADTENDYQYALTMQEYIEDACRSSVSLGELPLSAPEGLEKSGYKEAAEQLISASGSKPPRIIAIAPDFRTSGSEISPATKITAYLACALAENGHRTALIDCRLQKPETARFFKLTPKGSLSDIISGSCTVWDALNINARKGVDVIADSKSVSSPAAVFSSPEYAQLTEYLSAQYDVILLCAPKAFDCPEWESVTRSCTGIVTVCGDEPMRPDTAKGILGFKKGFTALCSVKKPPKEN
ncbi:MAG: hypothetical protein ACI4J0_01675 [Huintestinicola sp.]|uniref:hypothetical protein n=1 Tax=Huintestinicola sp. TaxID=2981661 RepID=UPI003F039183